MHIHILRNTKGLTLAMTVVIMALLLIITPVLYFNLRHESESAFKKKGSDIAFYLAEAGIKRAEWKLNESITIWNDAVEGTMPAGYQGTTLFTDIEGGEYKITMTAGPAANQVTVISQGRDASTNETRAIRLILGKVSLLYAIVNTNKEMKLTNNKVTVHWGPVYITDEIKFEPTLFFPRKFARGKIKDRDTDPSGDNTDNIEFWAFDTTLPDPPDIDFAAYIALAKANTIDVDPPGTGIITSNGNELAVATPLGSGYFSNSLNPQGITISGDYTLVDQSKVIFVEAADNKACTLQDVFLDIKALISTGKVVFSPNSTGITYTADIPPNAEEEYGIKNIADITEYQNMYPESTIDQTDINDVNAQWSIFDGQATYDVPNCVFHGFLYAGQKIEGGGSTTRSIVGSIYCDGKIDPANVAVYYDPAVAANIELEDDGTIQQISWDDTALPW
ncbi:MAG: hypothetical protein ABII23_06520 [bacterium]